ncbi:MAG: DUF1566 domain-containing protein [Prevotellaceae bacterium]|nr:DUF1566 domain-containing protein [Prevotellaceae bacterium]
MGATNATDYGHYLAWGGSQHKVDDHNTGSSALSGDSDTANKLWGSNWRMPTSEELQGLLDSCEVEWTTVGGVNGRKFTGKGDYASNSIFLPAAGYCSGGYVGGQGSDGIYWSSTPDGNKKAYSLDFNSSSQKAYNYGRADGFSVRAVLYEEDN